jgi:PPE-repeat protein
MDYGAFPPEFNSARMYAGPGSGPMIAAGAAWGGLANELLSAAAAYGSVITALTSGPWVGPSSAAMAAAAAPYVAWMNATAGQAELASTQAQAAAGAFDAAFAMTVPPPVVAANRALLMTLVATNFFGQNTAAIAATEAQYAEMWAQDALAMFSYAANAAAATAAVTPFTAAPQTTNVAGLLAQSVATSQSAGSSVGGVQSTLSQVINAVPGALQNLTSPGSSASPASGVVGGSSQPAATTTSGGGLFGSLGDSSLQQSVAAQYLGLPGLFGMFMASYALGPLMNPDTFLPFMSQAAAAPLAEGALGAAAGAAQSFGGFAGLGGLTGLGQAASVGALSVPANWGWAAKGPVGLMGGMPLAMPLASMEPNVAAGLGMPMMMGGGPQGAAASAGGKPGKYGMPLPAVMTRPPSAGYGPAEASPPAAAYPIPAGFPHNGQAPPGYQPAIVYLPTNGHATTKV